MIFDETGSDWDEYQEIMEGEELDDDIDIPFADDDTREHDDPDFDYTPSDEELDREDYYGGLDYDFDMYSEW